MIPFQSNIDDPYEKIITWPENCKYKFEEPPLSPEDLRDFCTSINDVADGQDPLCHPSNCTTASFLGVVYQLRNSSKWSQVENDFRCKPPNGFGSAYGKYTEADGLRKMFEEYGLGTTKRITLSKMAFEDSQGWPRKGDPILLQRNQENKPVKRVNTLKQISLPSCFAKRINQLNFDLLLKVY